VKYTDLQKFQDRYEPVGKCWLWIGSIHKHSKYGYFKGIGAHRFSYKMFKGEIPKGLDVMHSCDVRHCVNPDHLSVGTRKQNMEDCISRGRCKTKGTEHEAKKTKCPKGHPYNKENTYIEMKNGKFYQRRCRICRKKFQSRKQP
jgi:hypothetical protein